MSDFSIEVDDQNGRQGVLDLNGNSSIETPGYVPIKSDFDYLTTSPYVDRRDLSRIDLGELVCWLNNDQLRNLTRDRDYYNATKNRLRNDLRLMDISNPLIHFNFFQEVSTINANILDILLELQLDAHSAVIQVPNLYSKTLDYRKVLEHAIQWKTSHGIDTPLMGVACSVNDIDLMRPYYNRLDGIGINLSRFSKPLLYKVRSDLKDQEKWVHAYSAPREYPTVDKAGTLGVLINFYGVDTVSNRMPNWKSVQAIQAQNVEMNDEDLRNHALSRRYFSPNDYGTHTYEYLEQQHGESCALSHFCDCSVCSHNTIEDMINNPERTYANTRAHHAIAYLNEAENYQERLRNNGTSDYLRSKTFARQIID